MEVATNNRRESEQRVAEEYLSSLSDLNCNSKPLINMLTMLAEENIEYAAVIVKVVEQHIAKVKLIHFIIANLLEFKKLLFHLTKSRKDSRNNSRTSCVCLQIHNRKQNALYNFRTFETTYDVRAETTYDVRAEDIHFSKLKTDFVYVSLKKKVLSH